MCRICESKQETVDHILSGCGKLGFTEYLSRHNSVAKTIVASVLRSRGHKFPRSWWRHKIPSHIFLSDTSHIQWEPKVPTVEKLEHNKPDLLLCLEDGTRVIIEVTVCKDEYVVERSELKEQKYLELRADLARRYQSKVINIAIAIGITGVVSIKTREAVQKLNRYGIPLVLSKLQKAAATGSAIILRRVLGQ